MSKMKSFQQMASDLSKPGSEIVETLTAEEAHLWHMVTGISGESSELLDSVKKHVLYKRPLDRENIVEELGDLRFYMAGIMNSLDISEDEILQKNNEKLSKRYASGNYSNSQAIDRADKIADPDNQTSPPSFVNKIDEVQRWIESAKNNVTFGEECLRLGIQKDLVVRVYKVCEPFCVGSDESWVVSTLDDFYLDVRPSLKDAMFLCKVMNWKVEES